MNTEVTPSTVHGQIIAAGSKSISHRAIIAAVLAKGTSTLTNVLRCDDTDCTTSALQKLGARIDVDGTTLVVHGTGGILHTSTSSISLKNSGTSMRFLTAVSALANGTTILTGESRLCERPMQDLFAPLNDLGISVKSVRDNGCPPIEIQGGQLKGGNVSVNGHTSSQFASALLLIAPFAKTMTTIHVSDVRSLPYITLTCSIMKEFGIHIDQTDRQTFRILPNQIYQAREYSIEGDYSSSSYMFAAAAVTGGYVVVKNLKSISSQGDAYFLQLLEQMGCLVSSDDDSVRVTGRSYLHGVSVDMHNHPDIVQSLAIVAAFAKGTTTITNIGHLKHKETDRIVSTVKELQKMGIQVTSGPESIKIVGGTPQGTGIETHGDHRMAMSFAVAALGANGKTIIRNTEVVEKSYPNFFKDLSHIGGHIKESI